MSALHLSHLGISKCAIAFPLNMQSLFFFFLYWILIGLISIQDLFFVFLKLTVSLYLSALPLSKTLPSTAMLKTEGFKK